MRRRYGIRWMAVFSPILAFLVVSSWAAELDPLPQIGRIVIHGLETVEEPFVRLSIRSSVGTTVSSSLLTQDLETLMQTGLFRHAEVAWRETVEGRAVVDFELQEAPEVSDVDLQGVSLVAVEPIEDFVQELVTGMPNRDQIVTLGREIASRYLDVGYFGCGLRSVDPVMLTTDGILRVFVVEPVLGEVTIAGARRVRHKDLRRRLTIRRGRPLRVAAMDDSIRALGQMGTLQTAAFHVNRLDEDEGRIDLELAVVEESHMGEVEMGVRYERVRGAHAIVNLTRRNLFDQGATMNFDVHLGSQQSYALRVGSDWTFGLPVAGEVGVHSTEILREAREGTTVISRLTERRTGGMTRLSKNLPRGVTAELTFRDERIRAQAVEDFQLPDNLALIGGDPYRVEYDQQTIGLVFSRGSRGAPLTRQRRHGQILTFETAGGGRLDGPGHFWSGELEHRRLVPLNRREDLAFRLRLGGIVLNDGILPYLETKSLGGSETLRGYLFREFIGDRLLLINLEYRRRLGQRLGGVLFLDWGDCWESDERGFDGKLSYGIGARIDINLFELRIDAGKARDRDGMEVTFGVGHLF